MPTTLTEYVVFVSSPSDTAQAREAAKQVIQKVSSQLRSLSLSLRPLMWEQDIPSKIGRPPQDLINESISGKYDIFLGIIRSCFGTPTEKYGSGSEEELEIALNEYRRNQLAHIMYFVWDDAGPTSSIDIDQLKRVLEFNDKLRKCGLLTTFTTLEEFKELLHSQILSIMLKLAPGVAASGLDHPIRDSEQCQGISDDSIDPASESKEDPPPGLLDTIDDLADSVDAFGSILERMGDDIYRLCADIDKATTNLTNLRVDASSRSGRRAIKLAILPAIQAMQSYSSVLNGGIDEARIHNNKFRVMTS